LGKSREWGDCTDQYKSEQPFCSLHLHMTILATSACKLHIIVYFHALL
jgi:hypothetical protein